MTIYRLPITGEQRDFLLDVLRGRANETAEFLYGHLLNAEQWAGRVVPPIYLDGDGKIRLPYEHGHPEAPDPRRKIDATTLGEPYREEITELLPPAPASRAELLDRAKDIIGGDRAATYGDAEASFKRIGELWSTMLETDVSPTMVARLMIAMKLSRLTYAEDHADSWVDIAGYAALGAEIAGVEL